MNTQLEINKDSYVAFDATSLRDLIIKRLNKGEVFTDQNYTGSNISSVIEIISYSFSTLMFYLNKTSTESMFTESQIYENINRIVKLLGYDPLGHQTASVSFTLSASNIAAGNYVIPRYTYINIGSSAYSFNTDLSFTKKADNTVEIVSDEGSRYRLYQGRYIEYPVHVSTGADNEIIYISVNDNVIIDHFNIDIYVKGTTDTSWAQWERVDNLFEYNSRDSAFEIRLNENKRYEIKFGDNINGKKLNEGDQVAVYYIESTGTNGEVGANALRNLTISKYNSPTYNEIITDTMLNYTDILSDVYFARMNANNNAASTLYKIYDDVSDIRSKAPKFYKTQNRLVTSQDYISYIESNYSGIISDVAVKSNQEYIDSYIKYFYDLGISSPHLESRALYNQINFATSNNFNNIYIFALPRATGRVYLMPSQKEVILNAINKYKTLTSHPIVVDPVYIAADIAVKTSSDPSIEDIDNTDIYVETGRYSRRSNESIRSDIRNILNTYFNKTIALQLGGIIDIYQIYSDILNIDGVYKMYCKHKVTNSTVEGLSIIIWNPIYPAVDINISTQNISLDYFKNVYLNDLNKLVNKIKFVNTSAIL